MERFARAAIALRKRLPRLDEPWSDHLRVDLDPNSKTLVIHRGRGAAAFLIVHHCDGRPAQRCRRVPAGRWRKVLDSTSSEWEGPGGGPPDFMGPGEEPAPAAPAWATLVYERMEEPT
jgi:hypothetical protein